MDVRETGIGRSFDIIMYVLYSGDQNFIKDMVTQACVEVAEENDCLELTQVLQHRDNLQLYKCLFFLMFDFHFPFRNWVLTEGHSIGLRPMCPYKAIRFLQTLRNDIVPTFITCETMRLDEFERSVKVEYIRA